MSGNTFGSSRITTFGESHGKAIGAVIDGCSCASGAATRPPRQEKRRTAWRSLGGFEGKTTGTPDYRDANRGCAERCV